MMKFLYRIKIETFPLQIVRRSRAVIQIKEAKLTQSMSGLCESDKLMLIPWIIIDTNVIASERQACSLVGGFSMGVYDKSNYKGMCDGYHGETRLESECIQGEGLTFYFRQKSCIPDGLLMYDPQRTYCLANWNEGKFSFILLKSNNRDFMWVLRYPQTADSDETFTAFLMKDLYATDKNAIPSEVNNEYLSLSMTRQSAKTLSSMCYDDYEICSVLSDPCSYSEAVAAICARTCGYCSDNRPAPCHFQHALNGSWADSNQPDKGPALHINASTVHITSHETLHCIDWSAHKRSTDITAVPPIHSNIEQQMLVTISDNGCRPRFTCAKYTRMSSQGFFLQLSQTKLWPLEGPKGTAYDCDDFIYTSDSGKDSNPYRSRHTHLFVTDNSDMRVTCDLNRFEFLQVLFKDGVRCSGHLLQPSTKDSVQLSFPECPVQRLHHKFRCLEYSTFPSDNDTLLITKSHETPAKVHCWLFPKRPPNIFHIIESDQCNYIMKRRIRKGRLRPIATFTIDPTRKPQEVTEEVTEQDQPTEAKTEVAKTVTNDNKNIVIPSNVTITLIERIQTIAMNSIEPTTPSTSHKDNSDDTGKTAGTDGATSQDNTIGGSTNDINSEDDRHGRHNVSGNYTFYDSSADDSSPVVVAAVVITLIVIQIPLICKCSCS